MSFHSVPSKNTCLMFKYCNGIHEFASNIQLFKTCSSNSINNAEKKKTTSSTICQITARFSAFPQGILYENPFSFTLLLLTLFIRQRPSPGCPIPAADTQDWTIHSEKHHLIIPTTTSFVKVHYLVDSHVPIFQHTAVFQQDCLSQEPLPFSTRGPPCVSNPFK